MSENLITSTSGVMELNELIKDQKVFEAFLLVLFYNNLLMENPALDSVLFLFLEEYAGIAERLSTAHESEHKDIVSSLSINETMLDGFFLELWNAGVYGYPFFQKKDIDRLFSDIVHNPMQLSFDGFCSANFSYYLREKFLHAKDTMNLDEWENIMRHIFDNPVIIREMKNRLWNIAKSRREWLVAVMKEKDFPLSRIEENEWSKRISGILH